MPPKKTSGNQPKPAPEQPLPASFDYSDPITSAISIIDRKARNLEKRRNKLTTLKVNMKDGTTILDKDQQEAITKIKDVDIQLELVKELQKQFSSIQMEYQKYRKRQQKLDKQLAKESEHENEKKVVSYTIRVQQMLNSMGDDDMENFRTGSDGAIKLSEEELSQINELYQAINPKQEDNVNYEPDVQVATDHVLLLMESSPKEIFGTTYKDLHDLLERINDTGYFSRPSRQQEILDSEEDVDDYKSADDHITSHDGRETPGSINYTEEVDIPPEVPPMVEPEAPTQYLGSTERNGVAPVEIVNQPMLGNDSIITQTTSIMNYMPSAPSPTFPALGTSPVLMTHDDGFSFMHESELDRKQQSLPLTNSPLSTSQQITHQAPPPQVQSQNIDYTQYNSQGGVSASRGKVDIMTVKTQSGQTTDVTTGQPSPSVQPSYQSTGTMDTTTGVMSSSISTPTNHEVGVVGTTPTVGVVGGALYSSVHSMPTTAEAPSGYRQPQNQQNSYYRNSSQNKGGHGPSQGGGGNGRRTGGQGTSKGNYGANRNGRGMQGGFEAQSYNSRNNGGSGGGGGGYQQQRGRKNYRTNTGGQRRS